MADDKAATWPAAIENSIRVVMTGAFCMFVAFLLLRQGSCPSCQAKPCIPIEPPVPLTDEENLSMLLKRSNGVFALSIASLILVSINCMILLILAMLKLAEHTIFVPSPSDLRSKGLRR